MRISSENLNIPWQIGDDFVGGERESCGVTSFAAFDAYFRGKGKGDCSYSMSNLSIVLREGEHISPEMEGKVIKRQKKTEPAMKSVLNLFFSMTRNHDR